MIVLLLLSCQEIYRHDAVGIEFEKPKEWNVEEGPATTAALVKITLSPPSGSGRAAFIVWVDEARGTAAAYRDAAEATIRKRRDCTDIRSDTGKVAEQEAALLSFRSTGYATTYAYVVAHGLLYLFQRTIREGEERHEEALEGILKSVKLRPPALSEDWKKRKAWRALAARCESAIPWEKTWAAASARARNEGKPVFLVVEQFLGFPYPDVAVTGLGVDPDIVDVVRERFVPLLTDSDKDGPFDPKNYGIGTWCWGRAVLIADADGKVLTEACGVDPILVYATIVEFLKDRRSKSEDVVVLLKSGDLAGAAERLKDPKSALEWFWKADLHRRLRQGNEALRALERAEPTPLLDDALIRMRMGAFPEARRRLEALSTGNHARLPEALFWLGAIRLYLGDRKGSHAAWEEVTKRWPEDRWAWKAAANLLGGGALVHGSERPDWPTPEVTAAFLRAPYATRAERALDDAIAWLLRSQRADGSWIAPLEIQGVVPELSVATTALCARSLVPFADRQEVRKSIERAIRYVGSRATLRGDTGSGFDYSVWARICLLDLYAACLGAKIGDSKEPAEAAESLARAMRTSQSKGGGWTYSAALSMGGVVDPSVSFVTAATILALEDARSAGVKVDSRTIDRARACLRRLREKDGSFRYSEGDAWKSPRGAALRSPGCALALGEDLRSAFALYLEHRDRYRKELGKSLLHTGPEGQGSHYLTFDYALAARAWKGAPEADREKIRRALLEDLIAARRVDGSFLDSPIMGPSVATALAVLALERLGG